MKMGNYKLLAGAVVCLAIATAQAIPITGGVSFGGTATLNDSLASATQFNSINASVQFGASGSYSGIAAGTAATWTPFVFDSSATTIVPLWTITVGTVTYSFDALSVLVTHQDTVRLNISGSGTAHITDSAHVYDFDNTAGIWTITVTSSGSQFTFNDATTIPAAITPVPDGAATVLLLGIALSGLSLIRRKQA